MIKSISVVGIPVSNQDRALSFYTTKLGFSLVTDQPVQEGAIKRWIEVRPPGSGPGAVTIALFTPHGHENRIGSFANVTFLTDDLAGTYAELTGRGVEFLGPPKKESWGMSALFKDIDGNVLCLAHKF